MLPKLLEVFLQQVGANAYGVITQPPFESPLLGEGKMLRALENAPTGFLEDGLLAIAGECSGLLGADVIRGIIRLGDDVEAIENMHSLRTAFPNRSDIESLHIRADERDPGAGLLAQPREEPLAGLHSAFLATHRRRTMPASIW